MGSIGDVRKREVTRKGKENATSFVEGINFVVFCFSASKNSKKKMIRNIQLCIIEGNFAEPNSINLFYEA